MPFNGTGQFVRLYSWVSDAASSIKIRADRSDNEDNGFAVGLSTCITKDGQTTVTANLPMATFRHTGVGNGTSRNDYAALGQAQDGNLAWADGGGTADAITASYGVPLSALVNGQLCYVRATAANATTTPTFSPSGLTARTIVKNGGAALVVGDISGDGHELILRYDLANTRWELMNPKVPAAIPFTAASAATSAYLDFAEDTDNGTNRARVIAPAALAADATITLPGVTGTLATLAGTEALSNKTLQDSTTTFVDDGDATKKLAFQCSGITTGTTRTVTIPDKSGTLAMTSDILATTLATAVASTSGTTIDFTGIPTGAKWVTIMFRGVSVSGTSNFLIQIGDGAISTSGYISNADYGGTTASSTAGFIVRNSSAAEAHTGKIAIDSFGTNTWVADATVRPTAGAGISGIGTGDKTLAGTLDRVRITTVSGDTFDAGSINISWGF